MMDEIHFNQIHMYRHMTAIFSGLTVLLYLQTADFIDGITNGFGAKVVIHEPGTSPLPDDEGAFVFAAGETDISLKRVNAIYPLIEFSFLWQSFS